MKQKIFASSVIASSAIALLFVGATAYAADLGATVSIDASAAMGSTSANVSANASARAAARADMKAKASAALQVRFTDRANQEIDRRDEALNSLSARIGEMKNVSSDDKTSLSASIQSQISVLTGLRAKIDSDTDAPTLKADVKSITDAYRIFALVIPQGHLLAAIDSVNETANAFASVDVKLDAAISAAKTAGKDTTAAAAARADIDVKLADAHSQAAAAQAEISVLKPDNGDKTVMASNTAALKDARAKIKAATADLKAARADAHTVIQSLHIEARGDAGATTSASAQ